jgi:hypothetical protein
MWFARDIKSKIITRLQDSTYGVAAYITTINTERSETTEIPFQVNAESDVGQYPLVFVDLGDSTIVPVIGSDAETFEENFSLEITAMLKGNNVNKLKNDCENYIEAIMRSVQGYSEQANDGSYICQASGVQRADIDTEKDMTIRAITVNFIVYNNQL